MMKRPLFAVACALVLVAGCSKPKPAETAVAAPPPPPYNSDIPTAEVMEHVLNPAGYQFWSGWGVVVDKDGEHDLSPKTEDDWIKIENGASTIVIGLDAIMTPAYARAPQADWYAAAQTVQKIAMEGRQAAEHHDKKALGDIGARLDAACDVCHVKFVISKQK